MSEIRYTEEDIITAYAKADRSSRETLRKLFPRLLSRHGDDKDRPPVTERVKTLEDAVAAIGHSHHLCRALHALQEALGDEPCCADITAYAKLRVICAALNEGWQPKFTERETRWQPKFTLYSEDETDELPPAKFRAYSIFKTGARRSGYPYAGRPVTRSIGDYDAEGSAALCLATPEIAEYCAMQFRDLWLDFLLPREHPED